MKKARLKLAFALASTTLVAGLPAVVGTLPVAYAQESQADNNLRASVLNSLKKSQYQNVQVTVKDGVVNLEGTVQDFATKEEADKRVHRIKNVAAVRNMIGVQGAGSLSNAALQQKLVSAISYDRVGHWGQSPAIGNVTPFNAISVSVNGVGIVTLGGNAIDPVSADSAVALASRTSGVTDVINNIQVAPASSMDDSLRLRLYQAIYGYPALNQYATNPAQTIRIIVENGKVLLVGVVNSQMDKNVAGIRANGVSGVFSVTNDLKVLAGGPTEAKY